VSYPERELEAGCLKTDSRGDKGLEENDIDRLKPK
jgi:hypothetical protein